jgi:hypothetical protein
MTIAKAMEEVKELRDLYESDSTVKKLLDRAQNIEGMTRHCRATLAASSLAMHHSIRWCRSKRKG